MEDEEKVPSEPIEGPTEIPEELPELETVEEEVQKDPIELISEEFKKVYSELNTVKKYIKSLAQGQKMNADNIKLIIEESQ